MEKSIVVGLFSMVAIALISLNSTHVGEECFIEYEKENILQRQKIEYSVDFMEQTRELKNEFEERKVLTINSNENISNTIYKWKEEEMEMLKYVVQQEVGNLSLKHKRIIANVIMNRVNSNLFPNTISDVVSQKGQFTGYQNYTTHKYEINETTNQAVEEVLNGECDDLSMGAEYFYAPKYTNSKTASWFENNLEFLFEFEGHRFFKTKS